ncbi:MAG TPA: sodium/proton-translocating pyrophosphatase [Polyangiaceae bacterium]|nr:sodium/proton-translocating pyrophosphatase [Polyangiaceae bacterium]
MTEFGLTLTLCLLAVALTAVLARARSLPPPPRPLKESADTIRVGVSAFARSHARVLLILAILAAFVLFVTYAFVRPSRPSDALASGHELAAWTAASFLFGALLPAVVLPLAARFSLSVCAPLASPTRSATPQSLPTALRACASSGLVAVALPTATLSVLALAGWWRLGGFSSAPAADAPWKLILLLLGFPVGAALAGWTARVMGGVFSGAARMGATLGAVPVPAEHPKNPAWLARQTAEALLEGASPAVDTVTTIAGTLAGAMIVSADFWRANASRLGASLGVVMLAPMLLAFGLVASAVGVLSVRWDPSERPEAAFDRGMGTTLLLTLAGQLACTRWVLDSWWLPAFGACVSGLLAVVLSTLALRLTARHDRANAAASSATVKLGAGPWLITGLARGTERGVLVVTAIAVPLLTGWFWGARTGLAGGGAFGVACAAAAMLGPAAYAVAVRTSSACSYSSASLALVHSAGAEGAERAARLTELGGAARRCGFAQAIQSALALLVSCLLGWLTLAGPAAAASAAPGPVVLGLAVLVAICAMVWFGSRAMGAVIRAAAPVIRDIRTHLLTGAPRQEGDALQFEEGYDPEHASCHAMVLHEAQRQALPVGLLGLGVGMAVEVALHGVSIGFGVGTATQVVAVGVAGAACAGLVLSFAADSSASVWSLFCRGFVPRLKYAVDDAANPANTSRLGAAIVSDTVGVSFEAMAAPSLQALVKVLATVTLVVAPLFQ